MIKLGILLSGRGSNFEAILSSIQNGKLAAEIRCVGSNNSEAQGLKIAKSAGLPTVVAPNESCPTVAMRDQLFVNAFKEAGVEWVVLAGYMRLVGPILLEAFPNRVLNLHPSLLPKHKGLHAQRQALEAGDKEAGCTTHFVTLGLDEGPIILQARVPIFIDDSETCLSNRILKEEHRLYTETLALIAAGRVKLENGKVTIV